MGGEHQGAPAEDHTGERDLRLFARSLAARGEAPDGSGDGPDPAARDPGEPAKE